MSTERVASSIQHVERQIDEARPSSNSAGAGTARAAQRAVPYHCPFCAEADLRPTDAGPGAWHCAACLRIFSVTFLGLADPTRTPSTPIRRGGLT
ncbi:MAG: hypothetical protein WCF36_21705 [Candidatus Nanopelagicales bacterium]